MKFQLYLLSAYSLTAWPDKYPNTVRKKTAKHADCLRLKFLATNLERSSMSSDCSVTLSCSQAAGSYLLSLQTSKPSSPSVSPYFTEKTEVILLIPHSTTTRLNPYALPWGPILCSSRTLPQQASAFSSSSINYPLSTG